MKKVTAVEQLQIWLNSHLSHEQQMQFEGLFQQAKEMFEQQIIDATNHGNRQEFYDGTEMTGKKYYQETFK